MIKLKTVTNWISTIFATCVIVTCTLSNYVDAFKCDIVHASDNLPGWSNSKNESIKRGTYVCDVIMTHQSKDNDRAHYLKPLRGWVERSWRTGFWYLTTKKDTGTDLSYRVVIDNKGDKRHWLARNMDSTQDLDHYLDYNTGYPPQQFETVVNKLPSKDTLYFNVLRKDTLEFTPRNIEGVIRIVLQH